MLKQIEENLKCLADTNRLRIIKLLEQKDMCVCELSAILDITQPAVSKHLKKLKDIDIISSKQNGFWTDYVLNKNAMVFDIFDKIAFAFALNSDEIIKSDLERAKNLDRKNLCCKK